MIEIQSIPVLEAVKEYADFHSSFFFSYGAQLAFFEEALLAPVWQNNCRNNLVFIDSERYADTTSDWRDSVNWVGKRYLLIPIRFRGLHTFHSKLILLLGKDRARLMLGSGNLTFSGIGANHEVFTCLDWTEQNRQYQHIFKQVWQLIGQVQDQLGNSAQANKMYQKASHQSEWILESVESNADVQFMHNFDAPLLDQYVEVLTGETIREITIISPFLDYQASALKEILIRFKPKNLKLVIQSQRSVGDLRALEKLKTSGFPLQVHLFNDESRYLHAKIYLFKTNRCSYIFTGSANCTSAALLHRMGQGNFETMLLTKADANDHFDKLLMGRIGEEPVSSIDQIKLGEQKPLSFRKEHAIELYNASLSANILTISFSQVEEIKLPLGLEISALPVIRLSFDSSPSKKREVHIPLSDQQLEKIQQKPLVAHVFQYIDEGTEVLPVSNEIWITNANELNRVRYSLAGINLRAGKYLQEMVLGTEEEWRDLYTSLSQLIGLEVEKVQKTPALKFKIKKIEETTNQPKIAKKEEETEITFPDDYEISDEARFLEGEVFREGILHSLLEYANRMLPGREGQEPKPHLPGVNKPPLRKKPSESLGKKFANLVMRYIRTTQNADYMRSASTYHTINHYTIFQRMVWLLYKHSVFDQGRFVEYTRQINSGLFDTRGFGAPVLSPYSQKHIRRKWKQEWQEFGSALHALVSCIILKKYSDNGNENFPNSLDIDYPLVLAHISVVANLTELLNDVDRIAVFAEAYDLDSVELMDELDQFIETWARPAITVLEKWLRNVTLTFSSSQDQQLAKWLLQIRVDYGLALEQLYERLNDDEAMLNVVSDLVYWAERVEDGGVVLDKREKLMNLLLSRGDQKELARQLVDSGRGYRDNGLYSDATRQFLQALVLAEQVGEHSLVRLCKIYLEAMKFYVK
jgi:HKD family nuclease